LAHVALFLARGVAGATGETATQIDQLFAAPLQTDITQ